MEEIGRLVEAAPVDIELGGVGLRVASDDPGLATRLADALAEHAVGEAQPLGFMLHAPEDERGFYMVTDRSGFVLGRTRTLDQALAVTGGHLSVLVPPPEGTLRLRLRAVVSSRDGSVKLVTWPLLAAPPAVERRLEASRHRIIDRVAVDIDPLSASLRLSPVPWPALAHLDPGPGHVAPGADPRRVRALLAVAFPGAAEPTPGQVAHALAAAAIGVVDRDRLLDAAAEIASSIEARLIEIGRDNEVYDLLERT